MPLSARTLALAAAALLAASPARLRAQPAGTGCADLTKQYDEAIHTADGLVSTAVEHALKATDASGVLKQLGLEGQSLSPEQVVRRGALAALPPTTQAAMTTQAAIMIYLLRANTAMQTLAWKACPPPSASK